MINNNEFLFFKNDMVINWNEQGMLLKDCLVEQLNINHHSPNNITTNLQGKFFELPAIISTQVELKMVCRELHTQDKKYDFKDILKSELTVEDLFKIINKKITKKVKK